MRTRWSTAVLITLLGLGLAAAPASAEQAGSKVRSFQAGLIDSTGNHTCVVTTTGGVRCWGWGADGRLGYGNTNNIGDDELPSTVGNVPVGGKASAVTVGLSHACALLMTGAVRCWGANNFGVLGYGNTVDIGDDEPASAAGDVSLGGRATAISAGLFHTCALLQSGAVRCWGHNSDGRLGYGNTNDIGDDEVPATAGDVPLGGTATAISAGGGSTCAVLSTGSIRCWGFGPDGALGYGNIDSVGDDDLPSAAGDVPLGATAVAVAVGNAFALTTAGKVRCWGGSGNGALGRGTTDAIGDDETPASVGDLPLGGATFSAISAGVGHVCAMTSTRVLRCWGFNDSGQLGLGRVDDIGDDETAASVGLVPLGSGKQVSAVAAGYFHSCALLISGDVQCWGTADQGQLGTASVTAIGDDEPASVGEVVGLGAKVHGLVADLEVKVVAPATATTGTPFAATVAVRNTGPDAVSNLSVTVPKLAGVASSGAHDPAAGVWTVGGLSGGESATLTLTDPAAPAGARAFTAEVRASSLHDPDSTPANGAAGEDDRATVTTVVSDAVVPPAPPVVAPPVVTPPAVTPPPTTPAATRVRARLSLTAKPRPGSRRIKVTGKLVLPTGTSRTACTGRITLRLRRGTTRLATTRANLKRPARGRTCTFTATLRPKTAIRARQKLKITASLARTTRLTAVTRTLTKTVPRR